MFSHDTFIEIRSTSSNKNVCKRTVARAPTFCTLPLTETLIYSPGPTSGFGGKPTQDNGLVIEIWSACLYVFSHIGKKSCGKNLLFSFYLVVNEQALSASPVTDVKYRAFLQPGIYVLPYRDKYTFSQNNLQKTHGDNSSPNRANQAIL